ncbi:hypothetical protein EJD97_005105 [Solanum chilense]|uniref:Uncharacterized protein n=1 Tax=Solanum chilense TaxID=4083 RepID=A0A6N2BXV9_SOLCI|nr:hypothetical protein EJD97_005105 [Solanum chilense]
MDILYVLSIILLISSFVVVFIFIVECCTNGIGDDEITRGTCRAVTSPSFVNLAATAGGVGGGATQSGGTKDVTIVVHDGINGKVNTTTTTSVYSSSTTSYVENNKCGICKMAVTLESVNDGIRANDGNGDNNDAIGGASHAKISSYISS